MATTIITEYRVGRNFIRLGDTVRVLPSKPGRRDGFRATITRIEALDDEDLPVAVHLCVTLTFKGASHHPQAGMARVVTPDRIERCRPKGTP